LVRSFEEWSFTKSQGGKKYPTYIKKRECNWIGHIWCRNCLLKHVIEGKIEEISGEKTRKKT
jgi:hypothetical protein